MKFMSINPFFIALSGVKVIEFQYFKIGGVK